MSDTFLPYTTFELISVYAEMSLYVPKMCLPYFKTYENISIMTVHQGWYLVVSTMSDKIIVDSDMNELPIYQRKGDTLFYQLNFDMIVDGIKNGYTSYHVKDGENLMDYTHGVQWWGSLYNKNGIKIMNVKMNTPFKRSVFDKPLLEKMVSNSKISFIPIQLLHAYSDIVFGVNKKIKLPYITIRNCLRSMPVPYDGVSSIYIGVKNNITVYDHNGNICKPNESKYELLSREKPVAVPIYYWDFMKIIFTNLEYKFIDNTTGESMKFNDAVHSRAVMFYRQRTSSGLRPLFISLNV